jgi:hypothetical protein
MLSPRLAELHRDSFVVDDDGLQSTVDDQSSVDLEAHRGDSSLDELDLG